MVGFFEGEGFHELAVIRKNFIPQNLQLDKNDIVWVL